MLGTLSVIDKMECNYARKVNVYKNKVSNNKLPVFRNAKCCKVSLLSQKDADKTSLVADVEETKLLIVHSSEFQPIVIMYVKLIKGY